MHSIAGGELRIGGRTVGATAVALAIILVISAAIGGYLATKELERGGMQEKWTWSDQNSTSGSAWYHLMYLSNDTIYGREDLNVAVDGRHFSYFFALDLNGTLKWRSGINAQPWLRQGADGGFYYEDWQDISLWFANDSVRGWWYNITALDSKGNFKWDYLVDNGSLELWATYPDGSVIAHYSNDYYDQSLQRGIEDPEKVIAISSDGTEIWKKVLPLQGASYQLPRVDDNGTFLLNAHDANGTYEIGFDNENGSSYVNEAQYYTGYRFGKDSMSGTIQYEVRQEFVDNNTTVISVYATNISDGSQVWRTVLHYSDNPDHISPGSWALRPTLVDGLGTIYCGDIVGNYSYSLSSNGAILWQRPSQGAGWASYPSGGLLVSDGSTLKKINPDGSTAW